MTGSTRNTSTTALAVAIAAAIFAAPIAYSASKQPSKVQKTARDAPDFNKLAAPTAHSSFIVSFKKGTKPSASAMRQKLDAAGRALGVKIAAKRVMGTGAQVISVSRALDRTDAKQLAVELLKDPSVRAVEPNGRMYRMGVAEPDDPMYAQQWHYKAGGINVNAAWGAGLTGDGVTIAVIDTGSTDHEDLVGQWEGGYDFISDDASSRDGEAGRDDDPTDPGDYDDKYTSSWHGTHVAGTVGALTNNTLGVAGVAHGAKIQAVRVLGNLGGSFEDIADAIVWASGEPVPGVPDNPIRADIINMSLGGGGACNVAMQDAIDIAHENGTIVVVAAGNSSGDAGQFQPASCEHVITVAGTGPDNTVYASTNSGETIEVAAPAGSGSNPATNQVLSTVNLGEEGPGADGYAWYAGTSMASPHVAATIALMMEAQDGSGEPAITRDRAVTILQNTGYAENGLVAGCDNATRWCGSLIDASAAVLVASGDADLPPDPPGIPPPPPAIPLENGVPVTGLSVAAGQDIVYVLDVPAGATNLSVRLTGADGDVDLYVRHDERPTNSVYDCRGYTGTSNELCVIAAPLEGEYYIRVNGYEAATDVTLLAEYEGGGGGGGDSPEALEATRVFALKAKRIRVPLEWEGGDDQVNILFNGVVAATVANTGRYTHTFTATALGSATATYRVCNAGSTTECSAPITVSYTARR